MKAAWLGVAFWSYTAGSVTGQIPPVGETFRPEFFKGVCFSHNHSDQAGYGTALAKESLKAIRALGVNYVSFQPIGYSFNPQHPDIFGYRGEDPTLTRERLIQGIRDAKTVGLKVCLNPHLWIGIHWGQGEWRGKVAMKTEKDWQAWFRNYEAFILYFAEIAAAENVELFVVGSELEGTTLARPDDWRTVIAKVRGVYPGPCTYSANWGKEFEQIPFWDDLEYLGLSAYFPVGDGPEAERQKMAAAVRERLASWQREWNKPVLFLESGFQSQPGAGIEPSAWSWNSAAPADAQEQARLFALWMRTFWDQPWFAGIFWWQWFADPEYGHPGDNSYGFRGKPAEAVVRDFFAKKPGFWAVQPSP